MNFEEYLFCFFIYAFLGYICEVIYCSVAQKKLVNRGYLYMPICPIYGYGAVIILLSMLPISNMWYLVIICGILLTSTLEYLTSYFMELIFHMRWWDYSKRKFNINGRVCLRNSLMFGGLVVVVIYGIQPLISKLFGVMDPLALRIIDSVLLLAMFTDTIFSTIKNINIAKVVTKIEYIRDEAVEKLSETKEYIANTAVAVRLKELTSKYPNVSLRKIGKKKRISVTEFIEKHNLDNKAGEDDNDRGKTETPSK